MKDARFKQNLHELFKERLCQPLPAFSRLLIHKQCIYDAAKRTRNEMLRSGDSDYAHDQILTSISRAVWFQDFVLARTLWRYPLGRQHLRALNGSLVLSDPLEFARRIDVSRSKILGEHLHEFDNEDCDHTLKGSRGRKGVMAGVARLQREIRLWCGFGRCLRLVGVRLGF
eukprot:9153494-Karenia_brevis.AAC.1